MSGKSTIKGFTVNDCVNENCSQSYMPNIANSEDVSHRISPSEDHASARRMTTKRGRNGKKWVGVNWENKEQLKRANNGSMPHSEALTTSPFPHCDEWSEDQLPEILFYIKPPKSEFEGQPVGLLHENGELVKVGNHDRPLRDFPILPRRISLEVPGWLVETWRRLDPRITYPDILDRQIEDPIQHLKKLDKNALQNHCRRECRMVLGMWTNYDRRQVPHRTDVEAIEGLSYQNVMLNTILNVCPDRQDRLVKVRLIKRSQDGCGKYYAEPHEINETNLYQTTLPINRFILQPEITQDGLHSMDSSMLAAWELSLILQERARHHGVSHWRKLPDSCRPVSWFDRTAKKRAENETFDGGCSVCTWFLGKDQESHEEWINDTKAASSRSTGRKLSTKASSTSTSKRRKLKNSANQNGTKQNTFAEPTNESDCCKEVEHNGSWLRSEQYSEKFCSNEIRSCFRDTNQIEVYPDNVIDNNNSMTDPKFVLATCPTWRNIDPALLDETSKAEIESNGIGDLFTTEYAPQYEVKEILTKDSPRYTNKFNCYSVLSMNGHLCETVHEKWVSPHYFDTLWNGSNGPSRSPIPAKPITQYPTDPKTVTENHLPRQLDFSEYSPFWCRNSSHEVTNTYRAQSEPPSLENQRLGQNLGCNDWSRVVHSPSLSNIPSLATSFQTESESFSSDAPSLGFSCEPSCCNSTEVEMRASIFHEEVVSPSTFNDGTTNNDHWSKCGEFLKDIFPDPVNDAFSDSKTWQERSKLADHASGSHIAGGAIHGLDQEFSLLPITKQYSDEDIYEDGSSAIDESIPLLY